MAGRCLLVKGMVLRLAEPPDREGALRNARGGRVLPLETAGVSVGRAREAGGLLPGIGFGAGVFSLSECRIWVTGARVRQRPATACDRTAAASRM